jgi:hypothetical protein
MNISILSTASAKLTKKKVCLLVQIFMIYMSIIRTQTKMSIEVSWYRHSQFKFVQ